MPEGFYVTGQVNRRHLGDLNVYEGNYGSSRSVIGENNQVCIRWSHVANAHAATRIVLACTCRSADLLGGTSELAG